MSSLVRNGSYQMPDLGRYLDEIDSARSRRARELSDIKSKFSDRTSVSNLINSKAAIVLSYANWEGFYNDCARFYLNFLKESEKMVRETEWMLMVGVLHPEFESLRAKNHSMEAKQFFVSRLRQKLDCCFDDFESSIIFARSNLDFDKIATNSQLLGFDITRLQRWRIRLDKELFGWRHSVAHGDSPDLSGFDVTNHIDFASSMLLIVSDLFQEAMTSHI